MNVVPIMSTGATDGSFFRAAGIPVYGTDGGWGISPDDERAHGLDERIPVRAMYDDVLHWEMMMRALAAR
jgi:acetylornithine deacetylase/succinyl-diaminopimelate desuccinylase-like protein